MSAYRLYVAKSNIVPSVYLGINLPIFFFALLPAEDILSTLLVLVFLVLVSIICFFKLKRALVSDCYLLLEDERVLCQHDGNKIGEISPFSIVTAWFVLIRFKRQKSKCNKLILLNKLSLKDKKRILRAVYRDV